jgi:hypothetical protein
VCKLLSEDPSLRYLIDFARKDGLAYLALHASSRFGLWDLFEDSLKELATVFFSVGKHRYQRLILEQVASLMRLSPAKLNDLQAAFSVSIKVC